MNSKLAFSSAGSVDIHARAMCSAFGPTARRTTSVSPGNLPTPAEMTPSDLETQKCRVSEHGSVRVVDPVAVAPVGRVLMEIESEAMSSW